MSSHQDKLQATKTNLFEVSKNFLNESCEGKIITACKLIENNFKSYAHQQADEIKDMCRAGLMGFGCETVD